MLFVDLLIDTNGFDQNVILIPSAPLRINSAKNLPYDFRPFASLRACDYITEYALIETNFKAVLRLKIGNFEKNSQTLRETLGSAWQS